MTDTNQHPDMITVSFGGAGFFAVLLSWNDEYSFYEPYTTGFGRYETGDAANAEAKTWAEAEGTKFEPAYVGSTAEVEQAKSAERAKNLRARTERIKALRAADPSMSFPDVLKIARAEYPLPWEVN